MSIDELSPLYKVPGLAPCKDTHRSRKVFYLNYTYVNPGVKGESDDLKFEILEFFHYFQVKVDFKSIVQCSRLLVVKSISSYVISEILTPHVYVLSLN